jgi:uridine kinase
VSQTQGRRREVLERLARMITAYPLDHPPRIAVDGLDAAGKSTFADDLVPFVELHGRAAIRVSMDGFHRPAAERYRQGELSPEGCYRDSFDTEAFIRGVLEPLGPRGSLAYRTAVFDVERDAPAAAPVQIASAGAVLLVDGVFLLRPELRPHWEFAIFVDTHPEEILRRALARDTDRFGSEEAVRERYEKRYLPAQDLYSSEVDPRRVADVVVENTDPATPFVTRASQRALALER